jgi:hypothetical protein
MAALTLRSHIKSLGNWRAIYEQYPFREILEVGVGTDNLLTTGRGILRVSILARTCWACPSAGVMVVAITGWTQQRFADNSFDSVAAICFCAVPVRFRLREYVSVNRVAESSSGTCDKFRKFLRFLMKLLNPFVRWHCRQYWPWYRATYYRQQLIIEHIDLEIF